MQTLSSSTVSARPPSNSLLWPLLPALAPALLLFIPVLYYSVDTPFALIDDYTLSKDADIWKSPEQIRSWLSCQLLPSDCRNSRWRPLFAIHNWLVWNLFGANPVLHHLARWFLHFGAVAMFVAAFLRLGPLSSRQVPSKGTQGICLYLPVVVLMYIWLFFPNVPAARLGPQETYTVFYLALCNWMAALLLTSSIQGASAASAKRLVAVHALFLLGVVGVVGYKEVNIGVAAYLTIAYFAVCTITKQRASYQVLFGLPMIVAVCLSAAHIYAAYDLVSESLGGPSSGTTLYRHSAKILFLLFQVPTHFAIAAGFVILSVALVCVVIGRAVRREYGHETLFLIFLFGEAASAFVMISLSWGVVLRYWSILVPVFAMLLAFSARIILCRAAMRSRPWLTVAAGSMLTFVVFFVASNYYNFLRQTTIQHSLRHVEASAIATVAQLHDEGAYVQLGSQSTRPCCRPRRTAARSRANAEEVRLFEYYFGGYARRWLGREYEIHTSPPASGGYYLVGMHNALPFRPDHTRRLRAFADMRPQEDYTALNLAYSLADFIQGRRTEGPYSSLDNGAPYPSQYGWVVYWVPANNDLSARSFIASLDAPVVENSGSAWNVYLKDNALAYIDEGPCTRKDLAEAVPFFLHIFPSESSNLGLVGWDADRYLIPQRDDFNTAIFDFNQYGTFLNGRCAVIVPLPNYEIAAIRTGQYAPDGDYLWVVRFRLPSLANN